MGNLNFDSSTVVSNAPQSDADFDVLPSGDYSVVVEDSEFKTTNRGDGKYLKLQLRVVEGNGRNRVVWHNLNLENQNMQAVEIAQQHLAELCRACGKTKITDSSELHNIPVTANLKITPASGSYPESNDVRFYKKYQKPEGVSPDNEPF